MLNNFSERAGICAAELHVACRRTGVLAWLILAGWLATVLFYRRAQRRPPLPKPLTTIPQSQSEEGEQ
jgi:hypothetical protein